MIINIVGGQGIMGKIHKPIFEKAGHKVIISGRKTRPNPTEAAKIADLTIISVPIPVTEKVIRKIAPHSKAIIDFTSVKVKPVKAMLKYSKKNCEVAGLHPLYGSIRDIKGRTVIYCPTKKTGKKCKEVLKCLEKAGTKIIKMKPEEHDLLVNGFMQNTRAKLLEAYALSMKELGINFNQLDKISSPPTKILMDLIARQVDKRNTDMYYDMRKNNPLDKKLNKILLKNLKLVMKNQQETPEKIRKLFSKKLLKKSQARIARVFNSKSKTQTRK